MNKLLRCFTPVLFAFVAAALLRAAPDPSVGFTAKELAQGYRESALIALPRPEHRANADSAEASEGRRLVRKFARFDDMRVLEPAPGETVPQAIQRLRATGRYEFVEPDYLRHADVTPSDSKFTTQWSYANTGASNGVVGADISALTAWDTLHDAPNVIVAVIDSGARLTHGDLAGNLWRNPSPTFGDINGARFTGATATADKGNPNDDDGHGTHVAGIIGAVGNNGSAGGGVTGVAWKVQLMPLKFLTAEGTGSTSDAISCINYAIEHGAHIINASYGGENGTFVQAELAAIRRARDAGIIFVAAAGNEAANLDVSPHYPASYPLDNIVAVGNSDRRDSASATSNYGNGIELFAPGSEILSTYNSSDIASAVFSGTSMAAPHVTGALALLKAKFPNDNYHQLINRLLRSVDTPASLAGKSQTNGRLNLARALTSTDNRPFNDDFASRARLNADNISARASTSGATREGSEPAPAGVTGGGGSVWWQWTSSTGGAVTISTTAASTIDTVLAVYTGSELNALTPVASNDDATGGGTNSRVTFNVQAGVSYQIAVEGKNGTTGFVQLAIGTIPVNDAFASPVDLAGSSASITATNRGASRETGEPRILNNTGGTSLWYRWTAPKSGRFQVSAFTGDFDPLLAIYTGSTLDALTLVTSNDDIRADGLDNTSLCTFTAVAGTTYRFAVDAKANIGVFTLTLNDSTWQVAATDSITTSPAVAFDGTIYVGSTDKTLYAFAPDGTQKWAFLTGGNLDSASPAIGADGTVFVGSNDAKLYAVNPDGSQKWIHDFGTGVFASNSPAVAADGTIYLKATDGYVYAVNGADGSQRWRYNVSIVAPTDASHYGSPSIAPDGTIYQGSNDNSLYAINPDGSKKWTFTPATADGGIYSPPAIDTAGNLYFSTLTGAIYSITNAGTQRWRFLSGGNCTSSPALSADGATLYYGGYDKKLYALATSSGTQRWTSPLGDEVRASSPGVDAAGVIYIGCYDHKIYAINPDGSLNRTWATGDYIRSAPALSANRLYIGSNDGRLYAFDVASTPASGPWSQYRANARRIGRATGDAVLIVTAPISQNAPIGYPVTLSVTAANAVSYQWKKDGAVIAGATGASYVIPSATAASSGSYTVVVTGPTGAADSVTSAPAILTAVAADVGRLINLSVRTGAGTGAQTLIVGFAIGGSGQKQVLVRGIGPSLTQFNVAGALADPFLTLYSSTTSPLGTSDNWGGTAALFSTFSATGAFPLAADSKDAAISANLFTSSFTAQITGVNNTTGIALAELYDAEPSSAGDRLPSSVPRFINVSARAQVETGSGILIAGFVISGNVPKTVLIRAVGPGLTQFNVAGVLADPRLDLYRGPALVQSNDNWSGTTALTAAFSSVGAFPLSSTSSKDAALLVTLQPGSYTAQVSGVSNTTGVALIEVYEVP